MKEIILGEEQQQALDSIINFIGNKDLAITIEGYAGTGKIKIL